ncbi:divergent polysaccharide deacetylase family protein [Pelagimonas sp. KU-00592-HH]|uniref:divergent polysaccharide deacetylase family protein n=1 Tax=Pelagimonas sp. KU-00592-HH TaxID=3127651 RepID=UPI00310C73BE
MLRGLLSGVFWGLMAVLVVAGVGSLLAPLPATVVPQTSAVDATSGARDENGGGVGTPSQADQAVEENVSAPVDAPKEEDASPLADTASAPKPDVAEPEADLQAPAAAEESGVSVDADTPVAPAPADAPELSAPEAPEIDPEAAEEAELSITTNPEQPVAPEVPLVGSAFETPPAVEPVAPEAPSEDASPAPEAEEPEAPVVVEGGEQTSMLKPAGDLKDSFPQHNSSRLPRVGEEEVEEIVIKPIDQNAEAFADEAGRPLMSILLIDDGSAPVDLAGLSSFPYPLSFAVSTLAKDVSERVTTYRENGFEVLALIDIPAAAAPADVEVAMAAHLAAMPEAVGVLEGGGDGLQGSKSVSDQVTDVLLASGHGLVMLPKGLNTAQKLASREGVPSATVFRDFDGKGQSASVIRRFLDQAAFKAGQEGGVIMLGRVREETIAALLVWGLQDRASSVAVAPVSAVLKLGQ